MDHLIPDPEKNSIFFLNFFSQSPPPNFCLNFLLFNDSNVPNGTNELNESIE